MKPLHDDDKRAGLRVVQTGLQRVLEEVDAILPLRLAVRHERVLRVVDDDHVRAVTCDRAAHGGGVHHAVVVVLEFVLTVHVVFQLEAIAPVFLVPRAVDDVAGEDIVLPLSGSLRREAGRLCRR